MIKELTINNLAIIKNVQMEFDTNFAVITGETGAGKSLVLDGISLLLGKRSNVNDIMKDCDSLTVEGVIEISDNLKSNLEKLVDDIDFSDNELIIYRKITKDGKTKININGKRVTLATLASITKQVVDIVGQHENQYLLDRSYHLSLLDEFLP
ncbi:AAA family ATPase, partial [Sneathia sp. DSM 16630]|nr:AAA family ATPase [Sneathia sp. DSM 16630]